MDATNVNVRMAQPSDINRVLTVYEAWGYRRGINPEDTILLAEVADEFIGIVRIAPEENTLVLRGMRMAEQWRRRGIGSRMLLAMASWLDNRECYCVPYSHLVDFYGQIAFIETTPAAAPSFLTDRLAAYRKQGLDVTIMVRRPRPTKAPAT